MNDFRPDTNPHEVTIIDQAEEISAEALQEIFELIRRRLKERSADKRIFIARHIWTIEEGE